MNPNQWIVSAEEAKQQLEQSTILDTRNSATYFFEHIQGAVHCNWRQFSPQILPPTGKLIEDTILLQKKLRSFGISNHRPILVIGNPPHNFGEEGRIVWMLRSLGHESAAFVDGGYQALISSIVKTTWGWEQPKPGDFEVIRRNSWEIQSQELQRELKAISDSSIVLIDTRSPEEFAGATPYGEKRGGHIPGAVNIHFKELMDEKGFLLPSTQVFSKLPQIKNKDIPIVSYCTGGIRSAFVVTALTNLGFTNVKNYAGSMWEWSALPGSNYPLEEG